ncbi:MAG TPA: GSCFA domain-containing protein [Azospirillum sp.]
MSDDTPVSILPRVSVTRHGRVETFNGSWYRGEHTNFIPSKADLAEADALERYLLHGWMPPKPFIGRTAPITAFGSCFAAHVAEYLAQRGYAVHGRHLDVHAHIIRFGEGIVNSFAILQQFEWALEGKPMPENLWHGPNKEVAAVHPAIRDETRAIIQSTDVFIITLGLSEIWYDKRNGEAFWRAVPASDFDDSIHGFRISTVEENRANLTRILALIRKWRPEAHVVFTLSPIPLMATFRPVSCLTANSVSKAILRVAVDEVMREHATDTRLHYFPSYEIVKEFLTDPFDRDNRHVKPGEVMRIMMAFEKHFCVAEDTVPA